MAGWTALIAALLIAAGALVPVAPRFLIDSLDPSFGATLHLGAARGYAVGSRLISTFGPLGFVFYDQYTPETFARLLALRALLAAATCWALAWIGLVSWKTPWGAAAAVFVCAPFLGVPDVWLLTLPLLAVLLELAEARPPAQLSVLLGIAIGLACLIKFSFLLAAAAVLVPLGVAIAVARRRPSLVGLAALATVPLAWIASGLGWTDWLHYLDWSWRELFLGYADAMQIPVHWALTLQAAAVCAGVLICAVRLIRRRWTAGRWWLAIACAAGLLMLFRAGFVRADVHVYTTVFGTLIAGVVLAILHGRDARAMKVAAALLALGPGALFASAQHLRHMPSGDFVPTMPHTAIARLAALPLLGDDDALDQARAVSAAAIRAQYPLPPLDGAVDVYSHDQTVALAYDFDLRPRPVFHSYMAYTARLARANADFLLGTEAPEWILFRVDTIDGKLPALDDGASWPLLLARYRLAEMAGTFAILQKREAPLRWRLEPLQQVDTETGSAIVVPAPDSGPIWARIEVQPTLRDAVVGTLLSSPPVYVIAALANGRQVAYRLVPALARDGFLLSPLVRSTNEFAQLASSPPDPAPANAVRAMTIRFDDAPGIDGGPRPVRVAFSRLILE